MREYLDGTDLFAEILMLGGQGSCVILVEGPDDVNALDAHVSEDSANLIPGYGKPSVQEAIGLCDRQGLTYALAILDRDWVGIADDSDKSPNIVYTDMYDLDATIIFTGQICKRVASNFSDIGRMKRHLRAADFSRTVDALIPASVAIGLLRLIIREQRLPLTVRNFPVASILNLANGQPDLERMVTIAESKGSPQRSIIDRRALVREIAERLRVIREPEQYCSGHDLASALSAFVRNKWGGKVKSDDIPKAIRAAFGCPELMHTAMYQAVQQWSLDRRYEIWTCPEIMASA